MELCLALNRRNSAYLLENSRSNPTQPTQVLSIFRCILKPFCSSSDALDMLQDVCTSCVDPPESGLQELACRVQQWGVHMSEAMQEALHLVFVAEDIPKKPQTLSLRRTGLWCEQLSLPERKRWNWIEEGSQQGHMDGQHREDDDDDEEFLRRQADSITQTKTFWICRAPAKRGWGSPAQVNTDPRSALLPGSFCTPSVIDPPAEFMSRII